MENIKNVLSNIFKLLFLLACIALVVIGQKHIGYHGLLMMMAGLIGILLLLYFYNRKYK